MAHYISGMEMEIVYKRFSIVPSLFSVSVPLEKGYGWVTRMAVSKFWISRGISLEDGPPIAPQS